MYLNSTVRKYSSAQREVTNSEVFCNAVIVTTLHVAFLRISHTTDSSAWHWKFLWLEKWLSIAVKSVKFLPDTLCICLWHLRSFQVKSLQLATEILLVFLLHWSRCPCLFGAANTHFYMEIWGTQLKGIQCKTPFSCLFNLSLMLRSSTQRNSLL